VKSEHPEGFLTNDAVFPHLPVCFWTVHCHLLKMNTLKFETGMSLDGETPYLFNTQTTEYRKGLFCIQLSFFKGKVYLHYQSEYFYKAILGTWHYV
jgi:hypothetical protein